MLHHTADTSASPNLAAGHHAANMIALDDWPTYYGTASDPTYTVTAWARGAYPRRRRCTSTRWPVHRSRAETAQPNHTNLDRHLTIVDQTTGNVLDLKSVPTLPLPAGGGTIATTGSGYRILKGTGLAQGTGEG